MRTKSEKSHEKAMTPLHGKDDHDPAEVFALLYSAAEQGHVDAQIKLARYYQRGEVVTQNPPKAAHYYMLAAGQNSAEGLYRLAKCYLDDPIRYQLEEDICEAYTDDYYYEKKAFDLLKKAAQHDYPAALYEIAEFLEQARGGLDRRQTGHVGDGFDEERKEGHIEFDDQRLAKAMKIYVRAANLGSGQAQEKVFWYYITVKIGDFYDTEKIIYWANKILENPKQSAGSLAHLGSNLEREANHIDTIEYHKEEFHFAPHFHSPEVSHKWVTTLYELALKAYRKSYQLGKNESSVRVGKLYPLFRPDVSAGRLYLFGPDSIRDESRAYELFKESGSDAKAAYCHAHGLGCALNFNEAIRLLEKATDEGSVGGSRCVSTEVFDLGQLYEALGGAEHFTKAFESYCKGDSSQCSYQVGMCYLFGKGVEKDEALAFETFKKSSSQIPHTPINSKIRGCSSGDRSAHGYYGMALCLYRGSGVKQSYPNAFYCLSKAVLNGKMHTNYICPSEYEVYRQSLFLLGLLLQSGLGVVKNLENSGYFYSIAARLGHKDAILNLAKMLEQRSEKIISFDLHHELYVDNFESGLVCAEHMRSVSLVLGTGKILDEDMPFAEYIEKDQRPHCDELKGRIANVS